MIAKPVSPILLSENMAQLSRALRQSKRSRTRHNGTCTFAGAGAKGLGVGGLIIANPRI
jgi:hypothetical protein